MASDSAPVSTGLKSATGLAVRLASRRGDRAGCTADGYVQGNLAVFPERPAQVQGGARVTFNAVSVAEAVAGRRMRGRRPAGSDQRAAALTAAGRTTLPVAICAGQTATCLPPCHCASRPVTKPGPYLTEWVKGSSLP